VYRIAKQFKFSASHQLVDLPTDHQCARLHGHNYAVDIVLEAETLDDVGFVVDYGALKRFSEFLDCKLDHRHLNDVVPMATTAENLACWLFDVARGMYPQVSAIRVSETPTSWAEYAPTQQASELCV
jgi:6-pyruvoyltetrahydropterin/6-carboxytetrahydropterin synthase